MFPGVMKEQDVRQRIERFLKRTARELIIPASVGLSLALSGCANQPAIIAASTVAPTKPDAGAAVGARSGTGSDGGLHEPQDVSVASSNAGNTHYCGDGIVETEQGEGCDLGSRNGVCLDLLGNPTDAGQGSPPDAGCPLGTQVFCTTMCQFPALHVP
jgi:hypothetical protein